MIFHETKLAGGWDFSIKWTGRGQLEKQGADGISIFTAVEKQLGLKLELKTTPRPVFQVASVDETPTPNAANIAEALPEPQARALLRHAVTRSSVLVRNDGGLLPLSAATVRTVAVIGPNAAVARIQGGGSASVFPQSTVTPLAGIRAALSGVAKVEYEAGAYVTVRPTALLPVAMKPVRISLGAIVLGPAGQKLRTCSR